MQAVDAFELEVSQELEFLFTGRVQLLVKFLGDQKAVALRKFTLGHGGLVLFHVRITHSLHPEGHVGGIAVPVPVGLNQALPVVEAEADAQLDLVGLLGVVGLDFL
jgi:hypothetical protein